MIIDCGGEDALQCSVKPLDEAVTLGMVGRRSSFVNIQHCTDGLEQVGLELGTLVSVQPMRCTIATDEAIYEIPGDCLGPDVWERKRLVPLREIVSNDEDVAVFSRCHRKRAHNIHSGSL